MVRRAFCGRFEDVCGEATGHPVSRTLRFLVGCRWLVAPWGKAVVAEVELGRRSVETVPLTSHRGGVEKGAFGQEVSL